MATNPDCSCFEKYTCGRCRRRDVLSARVDTHKRGEAAQILDTIREDLMHHKDNPAALVKALEATFGQYRISYAHSCSNGSLEHAMLDHCSACAPHWDVILNPSKVT